MTSKFRTSIVIPSYCSWATLPNVLDALGDQLGSGREVILVDSSPDAESRLQTAVERWPWLTAVALDERTSPGKARNLGANRAQGELLAFLDADAMPEPGWLAGLEQALGPEHNVVAGAVANGTPQSPVGTAGYLLEFSAWLPGGRSTPRHGASCNLLFRRDAYLAAGGMPEDMWPGEDTAVTLPFGNAHQLAFAPDACVRHLNRTDPATYLQHQRRLGVAYALLCKRGLLPYQILTVRAALPLALALRLAAFAVRLASRPRYGLVAIRHAKLITQGLLAWCHGLSACASPGVSDQPATVHASTADRRLERAGRARPGGQDNA